MQAPPQHILDMKPGVEQPIDDEESQAVLQMQLEFAGSATTHSVSSRSASTAHAELQRYPVVEHAYSDDTDTNGHMKMPQIHLPNMQMPQMQTPQMQLMQTPQVESTNIDPRHMEGIDPRHMEGEQMQEGSLAF